MKRKLKQHIDKNLYHYEKNTQKKFLGPHEDLKNISSNLYGNCTCLYGLATSIFGDCSTLIGDCTGLIGDCTGVKGNLDLCDISSKDRQHGINIVDLIF